MGRRTSSYPGYCSDRQVEQLDKLDERRTLWKLWRTSAQPEEDLPGILRVALVVLAALAVHAAGGFEDVLRVEAAEGAGL